MKIEIEYPACALDTEETLIDDIQILSSISTREDKSANLSDYLSSIFEDLGVSGGKVKLKVKPDTKSLSSVVIYDIDEFIESLGFKGEETLNDEILEFCKSYPTYDEAVLKYGESIFEYELLGKINIDNGIINVV